MTSGNSPISAIQCAEDIALVHLLHPVITPPFNNTLSNALVHREGYTLPFDKERKLASILAFLANTKDDPNHIPAVCVAEDVESESLNVLLTVNKKNRQDGNHTLQNLKKCFGKIFQVLSQLQNTSARLQRDIFTAIVAMCHDRILCRLGFVATSRNVMKQPIKITLQDTIESLNLLRTRKPKVQIPYSKIFTQSAKNVIKMVDMWTKHQTIARLGDLIESLYHLGQVGSTQSILAAISNTSMDPDRRKRLLNVINKVGRYKEAARFLYRTAKRFPLVQNMRVVLVDLPPEVFQRPELIQHDSTLLRTLSRFRDGHEQQDLHQICTLLKIKHQDARTQFAQRVKRTLMEAKIHAEIQLLYHYEIESSSLPPRVVCSSKDACYICNYFILMHGKMHTPRCHGKIYPGWRLPFLPISQSMEERFNVRLEALVKSSLDTLLVKRKKIAYPDPNESTLLTLPHSMSTVVNVARPVVEGIPSLPTPSVADVGAESRYSQQTPQPVPMQLDNTSAAESNAALTHVSLQSPIRAQSGSSLDNPSESTFDMCIELAQGQLVLGSTKSGAIPRFYTAGPLELIFEHATEPDREEPDHTHNKLSYGIEWLKSSEADSLHQLETAMVINAESLEGEVTYDVERPFFVTGQGSVVKVLVLSEML